MGEMSAKDYAWEVIKQIPRGSVMSYGAVGRNTPNRVSGLVVGRWLAQCPQEIPWWRVLGADGSFPIAKRDPNLALIQKQKLEEEGIEFSSSGMVLKSQFLDCMADSDSDSTKK